MPDQPAPAARFLHALAAAALREGDPAALAGEAAAALEGVFAKLKSLVLDVQFTGFSFRGRLLGGADPRLLRAAGQLIVLRVSRVGFTPGAGADDLRVLFEAVGKTPAELGEGGVVAFLARRRPRGVYLSTSAGEVYRPPAAPPREPAAEAEASPSAGAPAVEGQAPSAEAAPPREEAPAAVHAQADAGAAVGEFELFAGDGTELSEFELLDEFPVLDAPAPAPAAPAGAPGEEPGSHDMYHFFRVAKDERHHDEAEQLPALLHAADNPARFDELAQACTRAGLRLVRSDSHEQAVALLDALVREARRPDRTRIFRDSAATALQRAGTPETLQLLARLLEHGGRERERILDFFGFIGDEAVPLLENLLFRTGDAELRKAVFRRLLPLEGMAQRIVARAMQDPAPARTRMVLELATLPEVDHDLAVRWLAEAAAHPDAGVRADVARLAAAVGGRGGLRVLVDLLGDRDPGVKRAAIQHLGTVGDAAAVPFLARLVVEAGDEELQVAAIVALGRTGSGEALPALLNVVNRRALFGGKKMLRVKTAALAAIARIPTPAARDVLASFAAGRDSDLAPEARRILSTID
ncbi:MAG TPA: HEAT repeat domain-containing protein [Longimicrobium sp.]|jgi:HEAT repeat protein